MNIDILNGKKHIHFIGIGGSGMYPLAQILHTQGFYLTVDNMLAVHDIKVVQGDERLFVAMPSRKDENGVFRDIVHPISAAARKMMEREILEAYHEHLALMEAEAQAEAAEESSEAQPAAV